MEIKVMSKSEVSEANFDCSHIVISVADEEDRKVNYLKILLQIGFDNKEAKIVNKSLKNKKCARRDSNSRPTD